MSRRGGTRNAACSRPAALPPTFRPALPPFRPEVAARRATPSLRRSRSRRSAPNRSPPRRGQTASRNEHRRAPQVARLEPRPAPRWHPRARTPRSRSRTGTCGASAEELVAVRARQVRDAAQHALAPQQVVVEARDRAHVDAGADDHAALAHRPQRGGDERPGGREDDRAVERDRRRVVRAAGPRAPSSRAICLPGLAARDDVDLVARGGARPGSRCAPRSRSRTGRAARAAPAPRTSASRRAR